MMSEENVLHQKTNAPVGKVKPWEHVWSIDEMRKDASNWHLASDVGVGCSASLIYSHFDQTVKLVF